MKLFGRFVDPNLPKSAATSKTERRAELKRFLVFLAELLTRDDVELPSDFIINVGFENDHTTARFTADIPEAKQVDRFGNPYVNNESNERPSQRKN